MTIQHTDLASGRWAKLTFTEQMANIGSEVIRAINWRSKGNKLYSTQAFYRALELFDLTLQPSLPLHRLREIARLRSALVDDFAGENTFRSTDVSWNKYFMAFTYLASQGVYPELRRDALRS